MELTSHTFEPLDLVSLVTNTPCVVIKFHAVWCGPCKSEEFKENYNNLKNKYKMHPNVVKFIELDIDEFEELINNKEYYDIEVKTIPHFKLTYNGVWAKNFNGQTCIGDIDLTLNKVIDKYYKDKQESSYIS
jgi:thiol-disulfide isomerase/thioredoxin